MNSVYFFLPFLLVASLGIYQESFAVNETRYYDYSEITNIDGSITRTIGLEPYIHNNNTNTFVPFINTGLITETEHGSVKLNGDSSYSYYPNGKIGSKQKLFTDRIIAKYADMSDLNTWTYPTALNNDTPDNTWSGNSFAITKFKAGVGLLEYKYIISDGKWKTQLEATNLSALNTKAFGFDQVIDLESDTIKFGGVTRNLDNFDGQTFDKTFLDNNAGKVIDMLNGYYFDFDLAYDYLYSVTVYDTGAGKSRLVFDFRTATPLLPNETLMLDPTFGNINDSSFVRAYAMVNAGANCSAPTGYGKDTTESFAPFIPSSASISSCNFLAVKIPLTNIPTTAVITDSDAVFDTATSTNAVNCNFVQMSVDIDTATAQQIYEDIISPASTFVSNSATCTSVANNNSVDLGATFDAIVQSAIGTNVEYGVKFTSLTRDVANRQLDLNDFRLAITYNFPPDPPKLFRATVLPLNGVSTTWSAGENNGSTHTNYTIQRYSDALAAWVAIETTTSTAYFDNEPLRQDTTKYRIRDNSNLGFGCYQFLMNSTVITNMTSYYPMCYTTNDNGIEDNDATTTGNELYTNSSGTVSRYYDGSSYDTLPNETDYDYNVANPFSIAFWINDTGGTTNDSILSKGLDFLDNPGFYAIRGSDVTQSVNFFLTNNGATEYVVTSPNNSIPLNTWKFVTLTYSGNSNQNGMKIYVDGVLAATGAASAISGNILNNNTLVIGSDGDNNRIFNGLLYNVMIYNIGLDAHQVDQIYDQYIDTYTLAMRPSAVTDLTGSSNINLSTVTLTWTEPPFVFGGVTGYMINYTTPWGDPITILTNDTQSTLTTDDILGLSIGEDYSFRVSPWNFVGTNGSGNIFNTTVSTNYVIGNFTSLDIPNTDDFSIFYSRTDINSTALFLNVTYPDTYDLECNMYYEFARTNNTYGNLTSTPVDADNEMSVFEFVNATGDVINVNCYDTITGDASQYVITITQFPFLDQIDNLRNGTYGTYFEIGAIDGITLFVIFIGMIGFNRTTPIVGVIFIIIATISLSYFGIITYPIIMYPALVLMGLWAFISTRKDD